MSAKLHTLRSKKKEKDFISAWTKDHQTAFQDCKNAIQNATLLSHPQPNAKTEIWSDASDMAMGAVLTQFQNHAWVPIAFWSKSLNKAQINNAPFDKELYALSTAISHFRE